MSTHAVSPSLDAANARFWDELCGTTLAQSLGITDHSPASLARFDRAYLSFYPYLLERVGLRDLAGKTVLEVGLGYGTLSEQLASVAADFVGLDVAAGPVAMVNQRLHWRGLPGRAVQGSILDAPFAAECVDAVVSIGCFHHTGDVQRCIDETYRLLRPGGVARIMVYNQFSYRQWWRWPRQTWAAARSQREGVADAFEDQRRAYDVNSTGEAAPETVFVTPRQLAAMFQRFSRFACRKENCGELPLLAHRLIPRRLLLPTIGKVAGLDLYVEAQK